MALTETDIKALRGHADRDRWVNDGGGLYLRILASGRRCWVWRTKKKRDGVTTYTTIGEWPHLTVKAARHELAKRAGRAAPPNALTVRDALEEWFADQIKPRYRVTANVEVHLRRMISEFGTRRLQEIEHCKAEVTRFLRAYGKRAPVGANRCLSTLRLAFGWCVEVGYLDHNPFANLTRRIAGGDEESRSRVLSDDEIRAIWRLDAPNANLLRALLLTGCRISELRKATRTHLFRGAHAIMDFTADVDGDWLFIPAAHSKNARAHYVYLVPETRRQFNGDAPLLFRAVSPTAVQAAVRRMQTNEDDTPREPWFSIRPLGLETREPLGPWVPHDLRRTFATRLGDLKIAPHVIEKLLNHAAQGVAATYNRAELLPERIEATRKWAAELMRIVNPIPLRAIRKAA